MRFQIRIRFALVTVLCTALPIIAMGASRERTVLGLVGVAAGQTLRLDLVAFPPSPCTATLGFVDNSGQPIGPSDRQVILIPGQAAELSLTSQALGIKFGQRVQVRPVVTTDPLVSQGCVATAELVDQASQFTTTLIPAIAPGPAEVPPGPIDFGMIGLARFQTLRLNVVTYPPSPCFATLSFADVNGNAVGPSQAVALEPGQGASLDLSSRSIPPGPTERIEVRAVVTPDPLTAESCVATAETFDVFSARTWSFVAAGPPNE